jgi:hypothetical protein
VRSSSRERSGGEAGGAFAHDSSAHTHKTLFESDSESESASASERARGFWEKAWGESVVTTVAGDGTCGDAKRVRPSMHATTGARALETQLNLPEGVAFDTRTGHVYVADTRNNAILRLVPLARGPRRGDREDLEHVQEDKDQSEHKYDEQHTDDVEHKAEAMSPQHQKKLDAMPASNVSPTNLAASGGGGGGGGGGEAEARARDAAEFSLRTVAGGARGVKSIRGKALEDKH